MALEFPTGPAHGQVYIDESTGNRYEYNSTYTAWRRYPTPNPANGVIAYVVDGAGGAITAGLKPSLPIPYNCTVIRWQLIGDGQNGLANVDLWKAPYTFGIPNVANTMTANVGMSVLGTNTRNSGIASGTFSITTLNTDDIIRMNVQNASTFTQLTLALHVQKAG